MMQDKNHEICHLKECLKINLTRSKRCLYCTRVLNLFLIKTIQEPDLLQIGERKNLKNF